MFIENRKTNLSFVLASVFRLYNFTLDISVHYYSYHIFYTLLVCYRL